YTVRYHLGELYEDYVVETRMIKKSNHLRSSYANRPIGVPADRDAIVDVIQEHLATGSGEG
ncbi:MAG: threonine synthase, partial [Anaerolineae bacterium]